MVTPAYRAPGHICERLKRAITCGMAKSVVNALEMVDVDDRNAGCSLARLVEGRGEGAPVGKAGERVPRGLEHQIHFLLLACVNVPDDADHAFQMSRLVAHGTGLGLEPAQAAPAAPC